MARDTRKRWVGAVDLSTVGIVGAGTMGLGIAHTAAVAGHEVRIHDVDATAASRAIERLAESLERQARRSVTDDAARAGHVANRLARVRIVSRLADLAHEATLVVEAAVEELDVKREIFEELDREAPRDSLLTTNTSALSVTAIATATQHPERVAGLHFFNPVPAMRLVELVATRYTAPGTLERLARTMEAWGKTPLRCADSPGFIVNRINRPFTLEALAILEEGDADVRLIDASFREVGYPMGPFELLDLIGIDVNLAVATAIHEAFVARSDPIAERFRPTVTQQRMVADGRLGRKTSSGFYRYPREDERQGPTADLTGVQDRIVSRIELSIIAEAYRAEGERIATRADIDAAMRLGAAHPYGPFENVARLGGPAVVVSALRELDSVGPRFAIPASLIKEAAEPAGA